MKHAVVLITVPNRAEALKLSRELVKNKLAACVNIVPGITSVFEWKGKLETSPELLCIVKTRASALKRLEKFVKKVHSYEVPEIIALPIAAGSRDYLRWVDGTVR